MGRDWGVLPPKLLFTLTDTGMESAEEGHGVTLDKFGLARDTLTGRLIISRPYPWDPSF